MPQSSIAYNLKWGNTTKSASFCTAQEMCAQLKKKMRGVIQKNKALVRALVEAKTELAYFKEAAGWWGKNEALYLPMLKLWLEADLDRIQALYENHVRATTLVKGLLTPGANVTLTAADSPLDKSTAQPPDEQQASTHSPGSRYGGGDHSMPVVLQEHEKYETDVAALHNLTEPLQPEQDIGRFSTVTLRKKCSHSVCRLSVLPEEPVLASVDQPSVVPAAADVDTKASILVAGVAGQENVSGAETVVAPPPEKLKGHSAHEYSAAFSHPPKTPPTLCSATKEDASFHPRSEDEGSSPSVMRVQHRTLPWPVKPVSAIRSRRKSSTPSSMAQGLSLPVNDGFPGVTEASLRSPTSLFNMGFMETPSPTRFMSNTMSTEKLALSPGKLADIRVDESSPPKANTRPLRSALKARPSDGLKRKAARVTFFDPSRSPTDGDAPSDGINDVAIPPGLSVNRQQKDEGGGGMQRPRFSATFDVAGTQPELSSPLHPNQDLCDDKKPPQARKSRDLKSRGRKKTADSKTPATPQPADLSSPPSHTRRRGRLSLSEPVAAGPSSSVGEDSPPRRSSGRPSRGPPKCSTYKEANLRVKLRRP